MRKKGVAERRHRCFLQKSYSVALAAGLAPTAVVQGYDISEQAWMGDIPKVVFATRQEQNITSAPSSVTVITREMIEAQGVLNLAEVFNLVPGFQAFYSNGGTFGVTAHGFSDRDPHRLEVRVNGRSVYLPQKSSVAWESIGVLPEDVDHIEVIRGGNVPAYGSNAIMGAINIVTRNPVKEAGGSVNATAGGIGTRNINGRQQFTVGNTDILVRAAHKQNDGFSKFDDDVNIGHLVVSGVYTPSLTSSLELEVGSSGGEIGIGDTDHPDEFVDEERRASWLNGSWQTSTENQQVKVRVSYTDYNFESSNKVNLSDIIAEYFPSQVEAYLQLLGGEQQLELNEGQRDFSVADAEFEHHYTFDEWQAIWGLGFRRDYLEGSRYIDGGEVDSELYYLFGNVQWSPTLSTEINAGFMVEKKDGLDPEVSPRLALNYHFNEQHHVRTSVTRAYRQPSLLDSDMNWVIRFEDGGVADLVQKSDPDNGSERTDTIELGYLGYWQDGDLSLDVKLFREDVEDEISKFDTRYGDCAADNTGDPELLRVTAAYCPSFNVDGVEGDGAVFNDRVRVYANNSDWTVSGLEAQATWKMTADAWIRASYAFLEAEGNIDRRTFSPPYRRQHDPTSVPQHSGSLLFGYHFAENWRFGAYYHYMEYINWQNASRVETHDRIDINLARSWNVGGSRLDVALSLQNLLDDGYIEYQAGNEINRRTFISVSYSWP